MKGKAYIFVRFNGAYGYGHVGAAFELPNGKYRCFGTENPSGDPYVKADEKGFWCCDLGRNQMLKRFRSTVNMQGVEIPRYDAYKIKIQEKPYYNKAKSKLDWCAKQDYKILSEAVYKSRTCLDDVCDTLSAYGLWMPWTVTYPNPNAWFGSMVDCRTYPL